MTTNKGFECEKTKLNRFCTLVLHQSTKSVTNLCKKVYTQFWRKQITLKDALASILWGIRFLRLSSVFIVEKFNGNSTRVARLNVRCKCSACWRLHLPHLFSSTILSKSNEAVMLTTVSSLVWHQINPYVTSRKTRTTLTSLVSSRCYRLALCPR